VIGPTVKVAKEIRTLEKNLELFSNLNDLDSSKNNENGMREYSSSNQNLAEKKAKKFIVNRGQSNRRTSDQTAAFVIEDDEVEDPEIEEQES